MKFFVLLQSGHMSGETTIPDSGVISHISQNNTILAGSGVVAENAVTTLSTAGKGYMGIKDIVDRPYFSDSQRFAELINISLYQGEEVLRPENLISQRRRYPSLSSTCGEMERDILIRDGRQNICYGIEIETESDYSMPERVITYDACEYEYQMREIDRGHRERRDYQSYREKKSRMREDDILLPTVTIVLYLGEGHWQGRRSLSQMFRMPVELRKTLGLNLHDYDFPLIEADYVRPEDYRTDLKEFFRTMQCRRDRDKLRELFHTESFQRLSPETERTIARHLHIKSLVYKIEKEELPMCKAFDDLMKEERREGKKEGRQEGKREEKIRIVRQMIREGLEEPLIRRITKCTREEYAAAER